MAGFSPIIEAPRVALVTGGSRGIGLSFAEALLSAGYGVAITAARDVVRLRQAVTELEKRHGTDRVLGLIANAGTPKQSHDAVEAVIARWGRIDILINNAGRGPREVSEGFTRTAPKFWETDPGAWSEIVQSNVTGPFLMARAAAPHMLKQGWGRIINISTSRVTMIKEGFAPYGPTKAALDAMTRIFATDLDGTGVTVNTLLPGGPTDTDFIPEPREGRYRHLLPVDVMNETLLWLVSDASNEVTAGRFVGAEWDATNPSAAREDTGAPPLIL